MAVKPIINQNNEDSSKLQNSKKVVKVIGIITIFCIAITYILVVLLSYDIPIFYEGGVEEMIEFDFNGNIIK